MKRKKAKSELSKPKNVTLSPRMRALAERIMEVRHFDDFSGFVQTLLREEHERRQAEVKTVETITDETIDAVEKKKEKPS